jgi:hypothetical protein
LEPLPFNLSRLDRALRILLGLVCLLLPLTGWLPEIANWALLLFAWVPLVTALVGWCPFYTLLGISTRGR